MTSSTGVIFLTDRVTIELLEAVPRKILKPSRQSQLCTRHLYPSPQVQVPSWLPSSPPYPIKLLLGNDIVFKLRYT